MGSHRILMELGSLTSVAGGISSYQARKPQAHLLEALPAWEGLNTLLWGVQPL